MEKIFIVKNDDLSEVNDLLEKGAACKNDPCGAKAYFSLWLCRWRFH